MKIKFSVKKTLCVLLAATSCTLCICAKPYLAELIAPDAAATVAAKKKLPIYCVGTDEKKNYEHFLL